jgi:hypothetical protein
MRFGIGAQYFQRGGIQPAAQANARWGQAAQLTIYLGENVHSLRRTRYLDNARIIGKMEYGAVHHIPFIHVTTRSFTALLHGCRS